MTTSSTPVRVALAAAAVLLIVAAGCTRNSAIEDEQDAGTTIAPTASVAPGTSDPSTDTTIEPDATESTTTSEPETDAFGHTAEEVAAFTAAYAQSFRAECQRIWASLGGGPLADPDFPEDQYSVDDCIAELDETWGELNDSVEEAATAGLDDAQIAASDLADPLCNLSATVCWSYGD